MMSMGDLLGRRDNRRLKRALMDGSFQAYGYGLCQRFCLV